jgi:hypothetical protein
MADSKILPAYDWTSYFLDDVNGDPLFNSIALTPCEDFDKKSKECCDNKAAFLAAISKAEGTSFLLIPTKGKKVLVLHSLFVVDPMEKRSIVVGTLGTRRSAPFKAVLVSQVIKLMTSSKPGMIVLPGGFDNVKTAEDFRQVKGTKISGGGAAHALKKACGFFLHPSFFLIFNSLVGPVDPADFAIRIIQHCCAGRSEEGEAKRRKKSKDKVEHLTEIAHSLLLFLWSLDGSNGNAVTIDNPPEHELVEAKIEFRGKVLRKWTRTVKALVREEEGNKKPRAKSWGDPASSDSSSEGEEDPERSPEP